MIESDLGRTDRPEIGQGRRQARWAASEAQDGQMWEPLPALALVDTELLEVFEHVIGERGSLLLLVGEDDHTDASGLAVTGRREDRTLRAARRPAQRSKDRACIRSRAPAEKGDRDVEVLRRHDADVGDFGQLVPLPGDEAFDDVLGQDESDEEAKALTSREASAFKHARS